MLFVMILIQSLFFCLALSSLVPEECADATEACVVDDASGAKSAKCLSGRFLLLVWQVCCF